MTDDEFLEDVKSEMAKHFGQPMFKAEEVTDRLRAFVLELRGIGKSAEYAAFVLVTGLPPRKKTE